VHASFFLTLKLYSQTFFFSLLFTSSQHCDPLPLRICILSDSILLLLLNISMVESRFREPRTAVKPTIWRFKSLTAVVLSFTLFHPPPPPRWCALEQHPQVVRQRKKNRFFYFFFFFFFDFSVSPSINFTILFKSHRYLYLFYSIFSFLMEFSSLSRPLVCDSIASTSLAPLPPSLSLSQGDGLTSSIIWQSSG